MREMKASGKTKAEWQPHVSALLQLKADLASAQKAAESAPSSTPETLPSKSASASATSSSAQISELEVAIKNQVLYSKHCLKSQRMS